MVVARCHMIIVGELGGKYNSGGKWVLGIYGRKETEARGWAEKCKL
jgi:hypothetical protein